MSNEPSKRGAWAGVAKLAGGVAVGKVLAVIIYPLLTRIYAPAELGVLSVYLSVVGIVSVVASLRYDQAIPLPEDDRKSFSLMTLSIAIAVIVSLFVGVVLFLWPSLLSFVSENRFSTLIILLVPVGVVCTAIYQALSMFCLRLRQYGKIGMTGVVQGFFGAGVKIGGGLLGFGSPALVLGQIVSQSAGILSLALSASRSVRAGWFDWKAMLKVAQRYRKFAMLGVPSAFLNSLALQLPAILIASYYGTDKAGFYGLAILVLATPVQLVGQSTARVFYAEASRVGFSNLLVVSEMLKSVSIRLAWVSVPVAVVAVLIAPWGFSVIFGDQWQESGRFVTVLASAYVMSLITSPASQAYLVIERQDVSLLLNILKASITIVSWGVLPALEFGLYEALTTYGVALSVYYATVILIAFILLKRGRSLGGLHVG